MGLGRATEVVVEAGVETGVGHRDSWHGGDAREEGRRRGRGKEGAAAGDGKVGLERGGGVDLDRIDI